MSQIQPSCCKCHKTYPLNDDNEWLKWGYIYKNPVDIGKQKEEFVFCGECFSKVKI